MAKTIPLQEALAFSFAAQRINGEYRKYTQRFSEDVPTIHANKDIDLLALLSPTTTAGPRRHSNRV